MLAERGLFGFSDKIADHVPEFAKHAKGNITVLQTITHQAGFPNAVVGKDAWADHKRLREVVCNFPLEFTPGSKVHYHGLTAHWTLGVLIEAVTGKDFRDVIRETVIEPLGLGRELYRRPARQRVRPRRRHARAEGRTARASSRAPTPTPPTGARPARRAAAATAPRARWPRSTR